jgi:hypothetical protein
MPDFHDRTGQRLQGGASGNGRPAARKAYRRPELSIHGSVRELTGSVTGAGAGDGTTMMN